MYNYEERKIYKNEKFSSTNRIWGKGRFNSVDKVGSLNSIFKEFYELKKSIFDNITCDDFADYYFKKYKSIKELRKISVAFMNECWFNGVEVTKREAFYYTIIRIIDETWNGFKKELEAIEYLKKIYPDNEIKFSAENDLKYCIDLEVYKDDVLVDAFQVKPFSFYRGIIANKSHLIQAYKYNYNKHSKFYKQYNIKPKYIIYGDELMITDYDKLVDKSYL